MQPARTRPTARLQEAMGWQPVARPDHAVLFINPRSGGGTATRLSLDRRARELGIEPVILQPGQDLAALVTEAVDRGADALGVAGGDGSMAVVAAVASAHGLPFVCVPAGTRNHFARDLGVLRHDVVGALEAFTAGLERSIDIGEVDGVPFLDNVVLGFYGDAVRREGYRDARLRTLLDAARDALGPGAPVAGLSGRGRPRPRPSRPRARARLEQPLRGRPGRRADDTSAARRRPAGHRGLRPAGLAAHRPHLGGTALELSADHALYAGLDGEAVTLSPPLRFTIRPRALRVRISARHPGASPAAQLSSLDPRGRVG